MNDLLSLLEIALFDEDDLARKQLLDYIEEYNLNLPRIKKLLSRNFKGKYSFVLSHFSKYICRDKDGMYILYTRVSPSTLEVHRYDFITLGELFFFVMKSTLEEELPITEQEYNFFKNINDDINMECYSEPLI